MAAQDAEAKAYLSNAERFADAFNFLIYDGTEVIKPDNLQELDSAELAMPYGDEAREPIQKFRDLLKLCLIKRDEYAAYVLLGIESQSAIHYAMPVKASLYDIMNYDRQVSRIAAAHRASRDKMTGAEFLSGFTREDRLTPVITLVINFSGDEWDGPLSLHEMMAPVDKRLLGFVSDYRINLLSPSLISDGDFDKFRTGLGAVMQFMKHRDDADMDWMRGVRRFESVDFETASLIRTTIGARIDFGDKEKGETVNMWPAWENAKRKAIAEGEARGRAETALEMLREKLPLDMISRVTKVSGDALAKLGREHGLL